MNNALLNPQDPPFCSQNSGPHFAEEENVVRGGGGGSYLFEATQLGGDRAGVEIGFMPGPV